MEQSNIWKKFLITDLHTKFLKIFKDIFLGIYLLKIDNGNVTNVCLYYIILCLSNMFLFFALNRFSKMSLMNLLRSGMFMSLVQCIILVMLGSNITKYIVLFAIFSSFVNALYYYPHPLIISKITNQENKNKYCTWDELLKDAIGIVFPSVFGIMISAKSYNYVFIFLFIVTLLAFLLSFTIKDVKLTCSKVNLRKLYNSLKEHNSLKTVKLMTLRSFFRGLSSFGVLGTLITLLTYLTVQTESSLGNIKGFITLVGVITLYIVNNKISRKKRNKMYVPMAVLQAILTFILTMSIIYLNGNTLILGFSLSFIIIFLYNLINGMINTIFEVANETIYYENINSKVIDKDLDSSYTYYFEVAINIPRILGYVILYIVSLFGFTITNICILIFILSLMYIAFAITLRKLSDKNSYN